MRGETTVVRIAPHTLRSESLLAPGTKQHQSAALTVVKSLASKQANFFYSAERLKCTLYMTIYI